MEDHPRGHHRVPSRPPVMSWGAQLSLGAGYLGTFLLAPPSPETARKGAGVCRQPHCPNEEARGSPHQGTPGPGGNPSSQVPARGTCCVKSLVFQSLLPGKCCSWHWGWASPPLPSRPQSSGCHLPSPCTRPLWSYEEVEAGVHLATAFTEEQWSWICPVLRACHSQRHLQPCHPSNEPVCP